MFPTMSINVPMHAGSEFCRASCAQLIIYCPGLQTGVLKIFEIEGFSHILYVINYYVCY